MDLNQGFEHVLHGFTTHLVYDLLLGCELGEFPLLGSDLVCR